MSFKPSRVGSDPVIRHLTALLVLVLALAGCGGSRDPILGAPPVATGPMLISPGGVVSVQLTPTDYSPLR